MIDIAVGSGVRLTLRLESLTIQNGMAEQGGGIYIQAGDSASIEAVLTDNAISENTTNNEGGGIRVESRAGGSAAVTLTRNRIANNVVTHVTAGQGGDDGGGIMAVTSNSGKTSLILAGNRITDNQAGYGGAILGYAWGAEALLDITMHNNILAGNLAREMGGAIFSCSGVTDPGTADHPGGSVY